MTKNILKTNKVKRKLDSNNLNIDLITLREYEEKGLVVKISDPSLSLHIWNYSRKCQYESNWDYITINTRCLITDFDGNIVAKGFKKFFNLHEIDKKQIPKESFDVYEKLDGSIILAFKYNGNWVISSKGSFYSDQAIAAKELFFKLNYDKYLTEDNCTYVFEYLSDWNQIVVRYDKERLVLLSIIETKTGNDIDLNVLKSIENIDVVKKYNYVDDYNLLTKIYDGDNREGFVIKFKSGYRIKIKYLEYIRLHKIITNITSYYIWEHLKNNRDIEELLVRIPDEFDNWVRTTIKKIQNNFKAYKKNVETEFWNIINIKELPTKIKESEYQHILFKRLNSYSDEYNQIIWDKVKPKFERPFNNIKK